MKLHEIIQKTFQGLGAKPEEIAEIIEAGSRQFGPSYGEQDISPAQAKRLVARLIVQHAYMMRIRDTQGNDAMIEEARKQCAAIEEGFREQFKGN